MTTIIISSVTIVIMIAVILKFPQLKLGKLTISPYWLITLVGAIILLAVGSIDIKVLLSALTADTAVNPLKILVFFLSMTMLSIFLDEVGFLRYLADKVIRTAKNSQLKIFILLYVMVSVLTVFTSNDIIILTLTPFICYFAKNAKVNPLPYLIAEFVSANTWSMALIIGNPTNVYLATIADINFTEYVKVMLLPSVFGGLTSFFILLALFYRQLKLPITPVFSEVKITNKPILIVGLTLIIVCTALLIVSGYIGIEMWLIAIVMFILLVILVLITNLCQRSKPVALWSTLKRAPLELVPFVLSMFVMVLALDANSITAQIADFLGEKNTVWIYGATSFFTANLINNIPMSVLFSSIINASSANASAAIYSSIIGSNVCAIFTPIGALAGIMWSNLLRHHNIKFSFGAFLRYGITVAIPTLIASLGGLALMLYIL